MPIGREASDAHQFPYTHLSTFIIQEYKTTQSNLSSYKDSLAHASAARHIKDSSPPPPPPPPPKKKTPPPPPPFSGTMLGGQYAIRMH